MHNAAGDRVEIELGNRNDTYLEVVSDLVALIDHVRASLKLIERATAQEASLGNQGVCASVIVAGRHASMPRHASMASAMRRITVSFAVRSGGARRGHHESGVIEVGGDEERRPAATLLMPSLRDEQIAGAIFRQ